MLVEGASFRFDLDHGRGRRQRASACRIRRSSRRSRSARRCWSTTARSGCKVTECSPEHALTEVVVGGEISNRKGVNVPDVVLPLAALSAKDHKDLEFACSLGVDWLALSFVQRAGDVFEARELADGRAAILSKIEKPAAVDAFAEILEASDGIMVARGDLGVELPVHAGAADPEAADPRLPRRRQAGDRRDPDAREHDHRPGADPRRGLRRRDRDLRGRRRDHAVGRVGRRRLSDRRR